MNNKKWSGPMMVLMGLGFLVYGWSESQVSARLKSGGVEVSGRILGHQTQPGRRGSKKYYLSVQFTPGTKQGPSVVADFEVPLLRFNMTQDGEPIKVRHMPDNPEVAEVDGGIQPGGGRMFAGAIVGVVGLIVSLFAFRE